MTPYFVITFKIQMPMWRPSPDRLQMFAKDPVLRCLPQLPRSDPIFMKDDPYQMFVHPGHQGAQDGMREARLCWCCADILQSGRLDSSTRRAEDEPLMFSAASYCSSSCVALPKFLFPEFNVTPSASEQRSTEFGLDLWTQPLSPRSWSCQGPRLRGSKSHYRGDEDQMFRV